MAFISYAQNYEDVMLWRALKHVDKGFYLDVGAQDPESDSVTKAFYDRGWSGINIEPSRQWFAKLEKQRTRDINLRIAAGAEDGESILYEIPDTGLSTLDKDVAERHRKVYGYDITLFKVTVKSIRTICTEYYDKQLHFMKIDVEGAEKAVLQGIDFKVIKPWILVVEATFPNTEVENYLEWESLVISAGYNFRYFDGLNRFYVSKEHHELYSAFDVPPNFFDNFIRSNEYKATNRAIEAENRAIEAENRAIEAEVGAKELLNQLCDIQKSLSWRLTKPMRMANKLLRIMHINTSIYLKEIIRNIFLSTIKIINRAPIFKSIVNGVFNRFPFINHFYVRLKNRLFPELSNALKISKNDQEVIMSNSAKRIYYDLKEAIQKGAKNNNANGNRPSRSSNSESL